MASNSPQESHKPRTISQQDRQYYYDAGAHVQREIWRPGDGDGDPDAEIYDRNASRPPPHKRWRFFQLSHRYGISKANLPPRYVILDDLACWEVFNSNIPKSQRAESWSHDFGAAGQIRTRRPHRGRGALRKPSEMKNGNGQGGIEGQSEFECIYIGSGEKQKYDFTGERDYVAVDFPNHDHDCEWRTGLGDESTSASPPQSGGQHNGSITSQGGSPTKKQRLKESHNTSCGSAKHPSVPTGTLMTGIFFSQPESLHPLTKTVGPGYFESLNKKTEACTVGEHLKLVAEVAELKLTLANAVERIELLEEYLEKDL